MNIKPGDLVMVVKPMPCCGYAGGVGKIARVLNKPLFSMSMCCNCNEVWVTHAHGKEWQLSSGSAASELRLKRLDPDALKDDIPTTDEVTA